MKEEKLSSEELNTIQGGLKFAPPRQRGSEESIEDYEKYLTERQKSIDETIEKWLGSCATLQDRCGTTYKV